MEERARELQVMVMQGGEASPPSVFLNQPSWQPQPPPHDDLGLDYISRMLMEEDIVDRFFFQYPDHPAPLQAQLPFAQILAGAQAPAPAWPCTPVDIPAAAAALPSGQDGTHAHAADGTEAVVPAPAGETITSSSIDMLWSMAFLRGMEEAKRFLPWDPDMADGRRRRSRLTVGRRRGERMVAVVELDPEEAAAARELLDRIVLHGSGMCLAEMRQLRVSMEREEEHEEASGQRRRAVVVCRPGLGRRGARKAMADLHTLLIRCAEAVAVNDRRGAAELLERIRRHSSPTGDAEQRLAHCFADALEARLAGTGGELCRSLLVSPTPAVKMLRALQLYMAASCFHRVAFHFSNKTIYDAVAGRRKLHVVHYGIGHGFQWPELLRWLAGREGGPPEVRITGVDLPRPARPAKETDDTGRRLGHLARQLGVPFEFRAVVAQWETLRAEDLAGDADGEEEVLVVNSMFKFKSLMDESVVVDRASPRDVVLGAIREMRPAAFVHGVANSSFSTAFFVTRFREQLYTFTAQFDMMDATVPRGNERRLLVERDIFARFAMNVIACEGADRVDRPQSYRQWQARNRRAGLRQLPLDAAMVEMLRETVRAQYHGSFIVSDDDRWLLQGWKGRVLFALSAWAAADQDDAAISSSIK